jgi:hypothetical protein
MLMLAWHDFQACMAYGPMVLYAWIINLLYESRLNKEKRTVMPNCQFLFFFLLFTFYQMVVVVVVEKKDWLLGRQEKLSAP